MKPVVVSVIALGWLLVASEGHAQRNWGSNSVGSGEAAARASTQLYNHYHPDHQLPITGGSVLQNTVRNRGSGMSWRDAWNSAAQSNAGFPANYGRRHDYVLRREPVNNYGFGPYPRPSSSLRNSSQPSYVQPGPGPLRAIEQPRVVDMGNTCPQCIGTR